MSHPLASLHLDRARYDAIADELASADSPVGIDAKKTHVYILHLLLDLRDRLDRLERRLEHLERDDAAGA